MQDEGGSGAGSKGHDEGYGPLQFAPFVSCVNPGFWSAFSKLKLEVLGLDEKPLKAVGTFANNTPPGVAQTFNLDWDALKDFEEENKCSKSLQWNTYSAKGQVVNLNTIEAFKACDKNQFLSAQCDAIWKAVCDGSAVKDPDLLNAFSVLMYSDLKKYHYYYWFAFPSFALPPEIKVRENRRKLCSVFPQNVCQKISEKYLAFKKANSSAMFVISVVEEEEEEVEILTLEDGLADPKAMVAFADPCPYDLQPGWPLRNLLVLLAKTHPQRLQGGIDIVGLRQTVTEARKVTVANSLVLHVKHCSESQIDLKTDEQGGLRCVGWEKNDKGNHGPKFSNMRSSMDPRELAASSVDLNLKLMKWRMVPSLDLDSLASLKCLLLGSGTLGCNVARCLLGWGVRHLTMLDNGKVSFSNPVRQSLYNFPDCLEGGQPKAAAAAAALKNIFPNVDAQGVTLSIPMPGHTISDATRNEVKANFDTLNSLVEGHDVIFLLMDSRESRWLPTVMAAHHEKLVINAALGYDSFLVMRHGVRSSCKSQEKAKPVDTSCSKSSEAEKPVDPSNKLVPGTRLGCYFCNDIVAPGNSTRDRSLDQQCTVTRPGVSYIAGALAVELMVSTLQHPQGASAPAPRAPELSAEERVQAESLLGHLVPHSIRGSIFSFEQFMPTTELFPQCTACSKPVLESFAKDAFSTLSQACNSANYLEQLTGLSNLLSDVKLDDLDVEFTDDEFADD